MRKYSKTENAINILFLVGMVVIPIGYCLLDTTIDLETGRAVILLDAVLSVFVLCDWYHLYISNTYKGILSGISLGFCVGLVGLVVTSAFCSVPLAELAQLNRSDIWGQSGLRHLMRMYVAGAGIMSAAIFSIPRLWLIHRVERITNRAN